MSWQEWWKARAECRRRSEHLTRMTEEDLVADEIRRVFADANRWWRVLSVGVYCVEDEYKLERARRAIRSNKLPPDASSFNAMKDAFTFSIAVELDDDQAQTGRQLCVELYDPFELMCLTTIERVTVGPFEIDPKRFELPGTPRTTPDKSAPRVIDLERALQSD